MPLKTECLRLLRRISRRLYPNGAVTAKTPIDLSGQAASDWIRDRLLDDSPCMISRFGSNELDATLRTFEQQQTPGSWQRVGRYLRGESGVFWWDGSLRRRMEINAGFFPVDDDSLTRFGNLMLKDMVEIDVLGSWQSGESRVRFKFPSAKTVPLLDLEPYRHARPWSSALAGKRVLVIHPFTDTIESQLKNRDGLFENPDVLPEFELVTLKAIQSNAKQEVEFDSWFEALAKMCQEIEQLDFEIAIIGAGAYGLPLAAFIKRMGKKAVHLGGATQLMFGIKGRRWDEFCVDFYNENWTRPSAEETPARPDLVEGHAYW